MEMLKTPNPNDRKKARCSFAHYGYAMIEGYCAVGIPLETVTEMKEELIGPSSVPKPTIVNCEQEVLKEHPECSNSLTQAAANQRKQALAAGKDSPQPFIPTVANWRDREMSTWVPNAMLEQFMVDSEESVTYIPILCTPSVVYRTAGA
jgi:hypothetical protein